MAKTKKKRNKQYRGQDAAVSNAPVVHHYEAVDRNRLSQWFVEHKTRVRIIGVGAAAAGVIALLVDGIATVLR